MASQTRTGTSVEQTTSETTTSERVVTLRLVSQRGRKKAVKWAEGTVDNENMNKKKSKKCCIFHKRRQFGDWSDDEDSDCEDCCHQHNHDIPIDDSQQTPSSTSV
eukprot:TRINITY_DN19660_c0_g1_i1.p6 TRINITY_DN19660_c0_g1~~TRINITY_DN19660_c0_g1_i1.p6  ORF type:complete len:105 (+),score=7.90 TRINITY_DN19660_c0_g1_i1:173-487(+)